ncbi:MAG: hypothetical protein FWF44_05600 [Defluviitaleaceae bacterium]|nr:hypothetical protein [Defluviitaleaceae bacterium]
MSGGSDEWHAMPGQGLKHLTREEAAELSKSLPAISRRSGFTMDGPGAWPGGGSLDPGVWYRFNGSGEWKYADNEVGVWFFNTGDRVDYIAEDENGEVKLIRWYGEED